MKNTTYRHINKEIYNVEKILKKVKFILELKILCSKNSRNKKIKWYYLPNSIILFKIRWTCSCATL